jgi:hypothetical protein
MSTFLFKNLSSSNNYLSKEFVKYIENTNNLCICKLGSHKLPSNLFFYKVSTITLINCSANGVSNILNPIYFPNLRKINYLSLNPGDILIHDRFKTPIEWVFPNRNYTFYRNTISQGLGYYDNNLIDKYINSFELTDSFSEFDLSIDYILNVPDYGVISADWYTKQFYNYLIYKCVNDNQFTEENSKKNNLIEDFEELHLHREFMRKSLEYYNNY